MIDLVQQKRDAIAELARAYGVRTLDIFGSAATGAFNQESSDIDFIVEFADMSPGIANRYLDFAEALERLLGRPVDLMFAGPISNPYLRRSVQLSRERVFEERSRQATS
ncbi:MAG: nucleotidyltransferase domain-containing protein [Chloroflexia bacterium]|jgi:predicted nucleotidyltransferase|nr:nucleotidyltransferase domain-containing protein [Chloroflexia bacterium]